MRKTMLWRGLTAVFAVLLAVSLFLAALCFKWEGHINVVLGTRPPVSSGSSDTMYFKTAYSEDGTLSDESLGRMLDASDAHDVQTMAEGAVLVKNADNALPLGADERAVTLFGSGSAKPVYRNRSGGAGIDSSRVVDLYAALEAKGFRINDALYNAYKNSGNNRSVGPNWALGEESSAFYTDALKASYASDYNDVAIVVLSRMGGEGNDLPRDYNGRSFLALQPEEADLLKMVHDSGKFGKTVVLLNSAYPMELGFIDGAEYGVDACLWIGGVGLKGFGGVAQILTGEVDPSGRFVDTYATDSLSAPAVRNFGSFKYTNASTIGAESSDAYVVQAEGIYIGYKYYETRYHDQVLGLHHANGTKGVYASTDGWSYGEEISYPFGYGDSYASFTKTLESVEWDRTEHKVTATVKVRNDGAPVGSGYTGKSKTAVQLYVSLPWEEGMAEKSAIQLVDFGKTKLLDKGGEDTVTITVDDYIFATYDEKAKNGADASKDGCYVFDKGDYYFAIGDDCHDALNNVLAAKGASGMTDENGAAVAGDADKTVKVTLAETDNTTHARSAETGEIVYNKLGHVDLNSYGELVTYMTRADWNTYPEAYTDLAATERMKADLAVGTYTKAAGAPAFDSSKLGKDKGIDLIDMKDVPYTGKYTDESGAEHDADAEWNEFLMQMGLGDLCSIVGEKFGQPTIKVIGKNANTNSDGPSGAQGSYAFGNKGAATQHVNEVVAASTWNKDILEARGGFIGEDCLYSGTTQLWSPGANLHRTPFSGRNHEYYSEDSVMSYLCGAVQVAAMQAKGVNTAVKHFCANDQETNRTGLSTFMTEQAYRQGPLKGFEGAFTKGGALSTMMSMARIGCKIMYEDKATITDVLRGEWGFIGVNITDSALSQHCFGTVESVMAGTDTFNADYGRGAEVQKFIVSKKDGAVFDRVMEINKRFYYSMVRSNNLNGVAKGVAATDYTPWWKPALVAIVSVIGVAAAAFATMFALSRFVFAKRKNDGDAPSGEVKK